MLTTRILGLAPDLVPYNTAWDEQRRIHRAILAGESGDTLLLLEHESVYTAGKRTEPHERPVDGTPVIDVDRGGKITWHGPGQLVGYPILRLPAPVDVVAYVRSLEVLLIEVLAEFGLHGEQIDGRSGVWIRHGVNAEKIAAVGVRVSRGVTMHGFALNCSNALDAFDQIIPCGIRDAGVTTMSRLLGRLVHPVDLAAAVERAFARDAADAGAVTA